jgi:membrane fusion protein (multidrug efflux system)
MSDKKKSNDAKSDGEKKEFDFPSLHKDDEIAPAADSITETSVPAEPKISPLAGVAAKANPLIKKFQVWFLANKRRGLIVVFIVIATLMWAVSWVRNRAANKEGETKEVVAEGTARAEEIPVNAIEARLGRFQDTINAVGSLKGEAEIELRFEADGRIDSFNVAEGQRVSRGQLIAKLNDRDARLKVERAKIELEQTEKLYQIGGVSKTKLDEARLGMDIAQSELDKTKIVASRDGIVGEKEADAGEFVNPQRKIAKLVAIKNVIVEIGIIEKQVDKVFPGQKVLVNVDAYPGNVFEAKIETISPMVGQDGSKTFSVRAKIPNPDSLLLPGMFARAKIIIYEADDVISVPNDSLVKTSAGFQIFVVNKDNVAEARDVQVGYVSTESTQIQGGIAAGDVVIVQKPPELKAGSKVKIIEVQK